MNFFQITFWYAVLLYTKYHSIDHVYVNKKERHCSFWLFNWWKKYSYNFINETKNLSLSPKDWNSRPSHFIVDALHQGTECLSLSFTIGVKKTFFFIQLSSKVLFIFIYRLCAHNACPISLRDTQRPVKSEIIMFFFNPPNHWKITTNVWDMYILGDEHWESNFIWS